MAPGIRGFTIRPRVCTWGMIPLLAAVATSACYRAPPEFDSLAPEPYRGSAPTTRRVSYTIANMNPFLYRYRLTIVHTLVVENAAADFFKAAFGVDVAVPGKGSMLDTDSLRCSPQPPVLKAMFGSLAAADRSAGLLVAAAATKGTVAGVSTKKFQKDLDSLNAKIRKSEDIDRTATSIVKRAKDFVTDQGQLLPPWKSSNDVATQPVAEFASYAAKALAQYPYCADLSQFVSAAAEHTADLAKLTAAYSAIVAGQTAAGDLASATQAILDEPRNFKQTVVLGPYDGPEIDSIKIERQMASATDQNYVAVATSVIRFGERPHLSVGGGVVWAQLPVHAYGPVARRVPAPDGHPTDTLVSVVGITGDAHQRAAPMVTLSTRLFDTRAWLSDAISSVGFTLGATVRKDVTTSAEFFAGPSVNLFGDWVSLSGGGYLGSVTRLSGVRVNDPLPSTTASVPVTTRLGSAWAAMLSFRLR